MAYGRSSYPTGGSYTEVGGEPIDGSPTAMVQALLRRESAHMAAPPRPMATYAPARPTGKTGTFRTSARAIDGARALMGAGEREQGRHSFVTNIKGGPQVMGGMVSSGSGASPGNTFYGGWQVDEPQGRVDFANLPDNSGAPAIAPQEDPAERAARLNAGLPRARFMPLAGR